MQEDRFASRFDRAACAELLPPDTADRLFEAMFGDPDEGSYDLSLAYRGSDAGALHFDIELRERPGKCLVCNLTYGLPQVFARHPVIDIDGMVAKIEALLNGIASVGAWRLGATGERGAALHVIPLTVELQAAG